MKAKIRFGIFDIVIGILLLIAITVNIWAYTRPGAKAKEEPTVPIEVESSAPEPSEPEADVPHVTESEPRIPEPVSGETVSGMAFEVDGEEGIYTGEIFNGVPEGHGEFCSNINGAWSYDGQWLGGLMHGSGVLTESNSVFIGSFSEGKMNGEFEVNTDETLRYRGGIYDGKLSGIGSLFTVTGTLIYEGSFVDDMLDESGAERIDRGEVFSQDCIYMNKELYDLAMGGSEMGTPVYVHGEILRASEQDSTGILMISFMGDISMPVAISYRYGVDEPKATEYSWIDAWGVVTGIYTYDEQPNGIASICPMIEVLYLTGES